MTSLSTRHGNPIVHICPGVIFHDEGRRPIQEAAVQAIMDNMEVMLPGLPKSGGMINPIAPSGMLRRSPEANAATMRPVFGPPVSPRCP